MDEAPDRSQLPESDRVFGELVVTQGISTPERVEECISTLLRLIDAGISPLPTLGELLLKKGYLSPSEFEATLKLTRKTPESRPGREGRGRRIEPPEEVKKAAENPARIQGKYVKVSVLGSGGMGEVWKAWDGELGRWVALKLLKDSSPDQLARFEREARTAARLVHPNIAAVHEVNAAEGNAYIVMQIIQGPTLLSFKRDDPRSLARVMHDAALAVHYAHAQGVVHRDLKPHNIMVEEIGGEKSASYRVFVMDFGLAKETTVDSSVSVTGSVLGTPVYMSPEQAKGKVNEIDARSDVYSLGATMYELLSGRPPFQAENIYDLLQKVVEEDPKPIREPGSKVDADLETIVLKCLEKEPGRRYASALELAGDLDRYLKGEPIVARAASVGYRVKKEFSKNVTLSIAVLAPLAAAIIFGTISTIQTIRKTNREEAAKLYLKGLTDLSDARGLKRSPSFDREAWEARLARSDERAREALETSSDYAPAYVLLGRIDRARRRWDEAIGWFERALESEPGRPDALFLKGEALLELEFERRAVRRALGLDLPAGDMETARRNLKEFLDQRAKEEEHQVERKRAAIYVTLLEAGPSQAIELHRARQGAGSKGPGQRLLLARLMLEGGRPGQAETAAGKVLEGVLPHSVRGYRIRASARLALKKSDGAVEDAERVLALDAEDPVARVIRAVMRNSKGDRPGALEDERALRKTHPKYADLLATALKE